MNNLIKFFSGMQMSTVISVLLIVGTFIDISPIKLNPLKAIIRFIGKSFNSSIEREISGFKKEVNEKFELLQEEQSMQREALDKLLHDQESKEISGIRWEIIDFDNSIVNGCKHTREQYRHILDRGQKYYRMIEETSQEDDASDLKEALESIQGHYDKYRKDQTALFF